ncbi:taurine catabolism dioxygenase TauD [Parasulfuritortus cantonensis]|uniref:Taurine catabolism dioxygenase TauD n=1 Tax=Parasulfuritortus cantonensis TaxID=2528202 RepID=A0A4R1BEW1_9PROT|nr:TauD/TfdA family dioxygenase [Parasulfuritortus cantonensis]TCJ15705.1 taurine catabolism dioxygenase TauD [Parasulfuritortus cantonensis]
MIPYESPFHPDNDAGYRAWRDAKLAAYPSRAEDLVVEVRDPHALTGAEYRAVLDRVRRTNMVVYATGLGDAEDKAAVRALSAQFGLAHLDANWLADEDGISSLTPRDEGGEKRGDYIPYTHHRIRWHTDGYYNPESRRILAMTLHCVREAADGGENELFDQDLAYIHLRDSNPDFIRALMAADAMTIPARVDEVDGERPEEKGPVFLVDPVSGGLHLRYTARTRSIAWKDDPTTLAAVKAIEDLLAGQPFGWFRLKLQPGMGLLCNNVLHTRDGFSDSPERRRLLYRARYHERIRDLRAG